MDTEQPDPEALYRLRGPGDAFVIDDVAGRPWAPRLATVYRGDHPFVVANPKAFELAIPEDADRRERAEILARLRGDVPAASVLARPKGRPGRPKLTEGRVRADLRRALASLDKSGDSHPSWDALAAAHNGLSEFGLTVDALRKRRDRFPALFRELVPHLAE